jgi:hypothetical protein
MAIRRSLGRTGAEISWEKFSRIGNISTECNNIHPSIHPSIHPTSQCEQHGRMGGGCEDIHEDKESS